MIHKKYPYLQDAYVVMNENSDLQRRNFLLYLNSCNALARFGGSPPLTLSTAN